MTDGSTSEQKNTGGGQTSPLDFSTFLISLGTTALIQLGDAPDPSSGVAQPEIAAAQQTIDILGMLQSKTSGNLTPAEDKLLRNLLYDLRMRFLQAKKRERS